MNTIRILLCAAAAALFLSLVASAGATVDMFLKIDGVEGESLDKDHRSWIEVESFSWGMSNSGSFSGGAGGGAGKANFLDLTLTKRLDKASPHLFLHGAQGKHIPEVVLVLRKAGVEPFKFFQITLKDVLVSSSTVSGSTAEDRPSETLTLNYTKIEWSYTPQLAAGGAGQPIVTSWNIATNTTQ